MPNALALFNPAVVLSAVEGHPRLLSDEKIADIRGYRAALAARPELLARNLARKLVTFATGVSAGSGDELVLDKILERSEPSGYGVRTLLHEVIQSELFNRK
jgi:hypothetical protein